MRVSARNLSSDWRHGGDEIATFLPPPPRVGHGSERFCTSVELALEKACLVQPTDHFHGGAYRETPRSQNDFGKTAKG